MKLDELEKKYREMGEEIERLKAKPVELRKRVETNARYFIISDSGELSRPVEKGDIFDDGCFNRGNYYLTKQAAEDDLPYVNLMLKLRHLARDMNDGHSSDGVLWTIGTTKGGDLSFIVWHTTRRPGAAYFKTEALAQAALDSLSDEELELIGRWR